MNYKIIFFIILTTLLTFITFWKNLEFTFWRDDWSQIWQLTSSNIPLSEFLSNSSFSLHPGIVYEELIFSKIFGSNPLFWNIEGIFLRIFGALSLALLISKISGSKRAAIFSGLILATTPVGMESVTWLSAHASALVIIPLCLGSYFWISSRYLISLLIFTIAILADPGRAVFIIPLILFWNVLDFYRISFKENLPSFLKRQGALLFIPFLVSFLTPQGVDFKQLHLSLTFFLNETLLVINSFLASIGNLLTSWSNLFYSLELFYKPSFKNFIPPHNINGISNLSLINLVSGIVFSIVVLTLIIIFFRTKKRDLQVFLFFSFWIFIFFLPNFLFQNHMILGGTVVSSTHRYLAISAVGFSAVLGYLLSALKKPLLRNSLLAVVIVLNILTVNSILDVESKYRSRKIVDKLWEQIDQEVPEEKNSIFMYLGDDYLKLLALDWSGSAPFGMRRDLKYLEDFPVTTIDQSLILKLLCGEKVLRPVGAGWTDKVTQIPLSNLHAWELNKGVLVNVSANYRAIYKNLAKCQLKK